MLSDDTPKALHKRDPKSGPPTPMLKLKIPVNKAKTLASIWFGVSWVNNIRVGSREKHSDRVSEIRDVKITYTRSGMWNTVIFILKTYSS